MMKIAKFIGYTNVSNVMKKPSINLGKEVKTVFANVSNTELPSSKAVNSGSFTKFAMTTTHKDSGGTMVFGYLPDNYIKLSSREFVEAKPERIAKFGRLKSKKMLPAEPAHWEETYVTLPHYYIDKIWSTGKGSGTNSIKDVVKRSLSDIETQGRVMLDACCIDGKTSPAGFYYKLGFRFKDNSMNQQCQKWLEEGGKRENTPFLTGIMFLPKENISHCLNY